MSLHRPARVTRSLRDVSGYHAKLCRTGLYGDRQAGKRSQVVFNEGGVSPVCVDVHHHVSYILDEFLPMCFSSGTLSDVSCLSFFLSFFYINILWDK